MKLFLEEETEKEIDKKTIKTISVIKEVANKAEAIKDKTLNKCYLHVCYHDKPGKHGQCRPCKREAL